MLLFNKDFITFLGKRRGLTNSSKHLFEVIGDQYVRTQGFLYLNHIYIVQNAH